MIFFISLIHSYIGMPLCITGPSDKPSTVFQSNLTPSLYLYSTVWKESLSYFSSQCVGHVVFEEYCSNISNSWLSLRVYGAFSTAPKLKCSFLISQSATVRTSALRKHFYHHPHAKQQMKRDKFYKEEAHCKPELYQKCFLVAPSSQDHS